jgi:hypothetical protein
MSKAALTTPAGNPIVLQRPMDKAFVSKLLHDRFQVMGSSVLSSSFYLVDHDAPDLMVREAAGDRHTEIILLPSKDAALDLAERLSKTPFKANANLASRVKAPAPRALKTPKPAKEPAAKAAKDPTAKVHNVPKPKGMSPARRFHDLITTTKLTDEEVYAKVLAEFPGMSYRPTYPAWYRKDLAKKGA